MKFKFEIKTVDCPNQGKTFYHVYEKGKLVTTFDDQHKASRYVQSQLYADRNFDMEGR